NVNYDIKDANANRREVYDEKNDSWRFVEDLKNHKRESSDVDTTVDDLMHSLQGICLFEKPKQSAKQLLKDTQSILKNMDVYRNIVKLNIQLRNKLKWIVEGNKGTIEVSRVITMLKNDVQDICKPLDLETPRDCAELKKEHKESGVYTIYPDNSTAMTVYCNMVDYDGGWTVLQRRQDKTDFYRTWAEYKKGFGNVEKSFWLGNDNIHILTSSGKYELRIDLGDWTGNKWYAIYKKFTVGNEASKYILTVGGYSGDAKDGLKIHNGSSFSTKDQDNDKDTKRDCAKTAKGGWWYNNCHHVNLNGVYKKGKTSHWDVVSWNLIKTDHYSMKFARMMIRRV
ncbi:ficolin, partial [Mytilus galloprovincialis]